MKTEVDLHRLRIFVNESDRLDGKPLYEVIVRAARDLGLAGATALRGIEGFGTNNRVHTVKVLRLSEDLPIVIEVVDHGDRINAFLPTVESLVAEGMITIEKVRTIFLRREDGGEAAAGFDDDELQLESDDFTPLERASGPTAAVGFTETAQKMLNTAKSSAVDSRRVYVDSVDVLLAMLCETDGMAQRALKRLGIDCKLVERSLHEEVSREEPSKAFLSRLLKRGHAAAKWLGDNEVSTQHLLLALCEIRPSTATDVLMRLGALPRDICGEVFKLTGHVDDWQGWMADHPEM